MPIRAIDHRCAESRSWEVGLAFWQGFGVRLVEHRGSDGHHAGTGGRVLCIEEER
jgi:hypothetical protein